jgi:hypothetical protein
VIAANQVETDLSITIDAVDRSEFPQRVRARVHVRDENGNHVGNLAPPYGLARDAKKIWRRVRERIDGALLHGSTPGQIILRQLASRANCNRFRHPERGHPVQDVHGDHCLGLLLLW